MTDIIKAALHFEGSAVIGYPPPYTLSWVSLFGHSALLIIFRNPVGDTGNTASGVPLDGGPVATGVCSL